MSGDERLDLVRQFIEAACVPRDSDHRSGNLERAEAIRRANPDVASHDIYAAAVLGDETSVRRCIETDPSLATQRGGPYEWEPLVYLCFSRYLRLDAVRSVGLVRTAAALLDAGDNPDAGWFEPTHQPEPQWESVLYGAAGVAHHVALARLLLERGANPNDGETPYHAPETHDNAVLELLLNCGKLTEDSLATMLVRKADWHDNKGLLLLLTHDANPNYMTHWGLTPLHQTLRRDNSIANIELMLNHGGDPLVISPREDGSAVAIAARRGRSDVLRLLTQRGMAIELDGVDALIAACALDDADRICEIVESDRGLVNGVLAKGGKLLAEFAGVGNSDGVDQLLKLGVDVAALFDEGDGYWDIALHSTALHVAAWRGRHSTVSLLIERGAPIDVRDGKGRTPLALAVRACVDSYWTDRRSPDSVKALLDAGASVDGIAAPSGFDLVDELLYQHGAGR